MDKRIINYTVSPLAGQSYVLADEAKAVELAAKINRDRNVDVAVWSSDQTPRLVATFRTKN